MQGYLDRFGEWIEADLWDAIAKEYPHILEPESEHAREGTVGWLEEEQDYHERFIESRLRVYVGREGIHNRLSEYLDGDSTEPLLLVGGSGTGKSAIMGKLWQEWQEHHPDEFILPHFVGASPGSTNLWLMLRRFCLALKEPFGFDDEIPDDLAELPHAFGEMVKKIPPGNRAVVLIDAVNQLDELGNAHRMHWLPRELSADVKIVVSCIEEPGREQVALDTLRSRNTPELKVEPLTKAERFEIVTQIPSLSAKTLDAQQVGMLLDNPATQNPLYLIVALEELRGFGSFERLNEKIGSFPRIEGEEGLNWLFGQIIERQEQEIGRETVRQVFSLIACSRMGLSERELTELLEQLEDSNAEQDRPGRMQILLRQLRPYLLRRGELVDYYHRNLWKAVNKRYLRGDEPRPEDEVVSPQEQPWHEALADYFESGGIVSLRMLTETLYHMSKAGMFEQLEALLTDLPFLEAKVAAGLAFELPADFGRAIEALPVDRPMRRIVALLHKALGRDIQFIARHAEDYPQGLFQCLWNTCWWYDHPEAANHYDPPQVGWPAAGPPWQRPGPKLCDLLDRWRTEKVAVVRQEVAGNSVGGSESQQSWLRSYRPPALPLGAAQLAQLTGHADKVWSVAFSPDGRRIASGSDDKTVRVWDVASGEPVVQLTEHTDCVNSVTFSPDGRRIASGSDDKTVRVWDAASGEPVAQLTGHMGSVNGVAFSPDGRRIASGADDKTVRVWDAAGGEPLVQLTGHADKVSSVSFSPDGRRIASGSDDKTVRVWDATSGEPVAQLTGHTSWVHSVAFSPDGCRIISAGGLGDHTVCVWDAAIGEIVAQLTEHTAPVSSVAFSHDGRRIASGSYDKTVRVWDAASGEPLSQLTGHTNAVLSVTFSHDDRRIASGSLDNTVRVWDVASGEPAAQLPGHTWYVLSWEISHDGRRIASGADDKTVRVWDAASGEPVAQLTGHTGPIWSVAFSPDGRRVASKSFYNTVWVWDAASGECLEVNKETGDAGAIAAGVESCAYRMHVRGVPGTRYLDETVVESATTGEPIAWFPIVLNRITTFPCGRKWAGENTNDIYILELEGGPAENNALKT